MSPTKVDPVRGKRVVHGVRALKKVRPALRARAFELIALWSLLDAMVAALVAAVLNVDVMALGEILSVVQSPRARRQALDAAIQHATEGEDRELLGKVSAYVFKIERTRNVFAHGVVGALDGDANRLAVTRSEHFSRWWSSQFEFTKRAKDLMDREKRPWSEWSIEELVDWMSAKRRVNQARRPHVEGFQTYNAKDLDFHIRRTRIAIALVEDATWIFLIPERACRSRARLRTALKKLL